MLLKFFAVVFVALVFIGLGSSGTLNAALDGYHTVTSNPIVHQLQNKATGAIIGTVSQFRNIENAAVHAIPSKI